jgi:hypothetical protein
LLFQSWERSACPKAATSGRKLLREKLIKGSSILYSIVHATQFFEFLKQLADISFGGKKVRLPDALSKASCV